jgi:hypothetical protein
MKTQIFSTNNYKLFKKLNGNRLVNTTHVKRIAESMKQQLLPTFIEVNEKFEVIDGQHRLEAFQQLSLPVHYIIHNGAGLSEAQRHNQIKQKWSYADILESHIASGNESYMFIKYLINKYSLTLTHILQACEKGNHGIAKQYMFVQGTLVINNKQEIEALVCKALTINSVVNIMRKTMWVACLKSIEVPEFDVNMFIRKLTYLKSQFTPQVTVSQQIEQIEEIYNYRNRQPINLRIAVKNTKSNQPNQ